MILLACEIHILLGIRNANRYHELSNDYANATNSSTCVASLEKENQMLKAQVEKLTSEHATLQGTHVEFERSYEMLVDSHVSLQVAHEVVLTSVTHYNLSHSHEHAHKFKFHYLVINRVAPEQQILVLSMLLQSHVMTSLWKKMMNSSERSKSSKLK